VELHDTRIERIESTEGAIVLWVSAYLHESEGDPAVDRGTGWSLPARLVVEGGEFAIPFLSPSLWITDGRVSVGDRLYENILPLPFDNRGEIHLYLSGAEGEITLRGSRIFLEPTGPAVYVEESPGMDEM
jgi:hypothetical protein